MMHLINRHTKNLLCELNYRPLHLLNYTVSGPTDELEVCVLCKLRGNREEYRQ